MDAVTMAMVIGAIVIIVVVYFAIRNKSDAQKMLEQNVDVVPLMLQKATQLKVARLQQATQHDTRANENLAKMVAAYKNKQLTIDEYNHKLDALVNQLEIDL